MLLALYLLQTLTASEIVSRSMQAMEADWDAASRYSCREVHSLEKLDAQGQPKTTVTNTYQIHMLDGSPYYQPIERPGELASVLESRAHESPEARRKRIEKYRHERLDATLLMREMGRAFIFTLTGETVKNGYEAYVLEGKPNPDYRPPSQKAKVLTAVHGTLWIDKQDYHWVAVDAEVTKSVTIAFLASVGAGTKFHLEQEPPRARPLAASSLQPDNPGQHSWPASLPSARGNEIQQLHPGACTKMNATCKNPAKICSTLKPALS